MDINYELHEATLEYLIGFRDKKIFQNVKNRGSLTFALRKSNRFNRLDQGFWFYGNEHYMALSFWTGNDWRNKTPNLIFVIDDSGEVRLEMTASDSNLKWRFIQDTLVPMLGAQEFKQSYKFSRTYSTGVRTIDQFINELENFLINDKKLIDNELVKFLGKNDFLPGEDSFFDFISEYEFQKYLSNISDYRTRIENIEINIPFAGTTENHPINEEYRKSERKRKIESFLNHRKYGLRSIEIHDFKAVEHLKIVDIPKNTQWIFITGENGSGKTSILQSIVVGLMGNLDGNRILNNADDFLINLRYYNDDEIVHNKVKPTVFHTKPKNKFTPLANIACYGPNRFQLSGTEVNAESRSGRTYNLFNDDGALLNIQEKLYQWLLLSGIYMEYSANANNLPDTSIDNYGRYMNMLNYVREIFLGKTGNKDEDGLLPQVVAFVENEEDEQLKFKILGRDQPATYTELSTGNKNVIALVGDIILRFFDPNENNNDPALYEGIVIIDEIDAHIHPKWQKNMITQLGTIFPKIQFIVTCHSPIPFLGIKKPENAVILKVHRSENDVVEVDKLDSIELKRLTPNTILTSPIFDFQDMFSEAYDEKIGATPRDNYKDEEFHQMLKRKLQELSKELGDAKD